MDAAQSNHSGIVDFVDFDNVEFSLSLVCTGFLRLVLAPPPVNPSRSVSSPSGFARCQTEKKTGFDIL